jgi:Rad3-related DNA helicase
MKEQGLEPFQAESLPEAVLRLKQGFGRLIRSSADVGTFTLLDPRVTTERWGKIFLDSLPDCERVFLSKPGLVENPYLLSKGSQSNAAKRSSKPHLKK